MKALYYFIFLCSYWVTYSQPLQSITSQSKVTILGTSSIHDWESTVGEFDFSAKMEGDTLKSIEGFLKTKSIESGKSIMNSKTYDALEAESFPKIIFTSDFLVRDGNTFEGSGKVQIAGKEKIIPMKVNFDAAKPMVFTGEVPLRMTDFGIDPPTAMFGTMTTGDEIKIQYKISMTTNSIK
ncbi:MAG: YceI family protein [Cyclobacteriaceae bacterium]